MSTTASEAARQRDAIWWQGSLMRIAGRAENTGGALGLVDAIFYEGFGPPLHVHHREDEGFYVLEGEICFRKGDDELIAGPGTLVWLPRGVPHAFKVQRGGARALLLLTPGGFEGMFEEGGVSTSQSEAAPTDEYDPEVLVSLAARYGMEVVGPPLA
jgi:mannose-6-phosphate isomerase-like protein (cupin superfamily)